MNYLVFLAIASVTGKTELNKGGLGTREGCDLTEDGQGSLPEWWHLRKDGGGILANEQLVQRPWRG